MEGLRYLFFDSRAPGLVCEKTSQPSPDLSIKAIFHPQILVRSQKIISPAEAGQRHGGLFLKDANQEVRLSFFNASLVFSLCPGRQGGRPFRQRLPFGLGFAKV
jgi:hypothetical protein